MGFFSLVEQRQSCRSYLDKPVEREKLEKLVETARLAPSARNAQPWHFLVVSEREKLADAARATQDMGMNKFTSGCPAFILVLQEKAFGQKLVDNISGHELSALDAGIALTHLIYAAEAEGLASCVIGWFNTGKLRRALGFDKKYDVKIMLVLGYAAEDEKPRVKKRKAIEEVATFIE